MEFHGIHYIIHQAHHLNIFVFCAQSCTEKGRYYLSALLLLPLLAPSSFTSTTPSFLSSHPSLAPPSPPIPFLLHLLRLSILFFFADSFRMVREDFYCKKLLYITWTKKNAVLMFKFSFWVRLSFAWLINRATSGGRSLLTTPLDHVHLWSTITDMAVIKSWISQLHWHRDLNSLGALHQAFNFAVCYM